MKTAALRVIRIYQKWISPMFPARCKYYPSCSSYALTAITTYGPKGFVMAMWRLARCNPWSHGGVDYVPQPKTKSSSTSLIKNSLTTSISGPMNTLLSKGETR